MKAAHQPIVNAFLCMQRPFSKFERARRVAAVICERVMRGGSAIREPGRSHAKLLVALTG